jgi:hypothetical protein
MPGFIICPALILIWVNNYKLPKLDMNSVITFRTLLLCKLPKLAMNLRYIYMYVSDSWLGFGGIFICKSAIAAQDSWITFL